MTNKQDDPDLLKAEDIGTVKKPYIRPKKKVEQKSMKKPIITTVVITLAVVAAFAATFFAGVNHANRQHADREALIQSVTKDLKAETPQQ